MTSTQAKFIPALRYHDALAAIEWLQQAFGFEKHLVVPGEENTVPHAQLTFQGNMIMLGSVRDDEFGKMQQTPKETGGIVTQSVYIIVEDVDAHHARAVAAGAKVMYGPRDEDHGGRSYSCKDPEGHLWNFGSYDPWA